MVESVGLTGSNLQARGVTRVTSHSGLLAQLLVETRTGIRLGAAPSWVCSGQRNRSILWATRAGVCSGFSVIDLALSREAHKGL
ncbi:hypothetical protein Pr1d_34780 [Bythopirellula goksoeyrii]|uniref:Uncharacterized protein n=2 Tax=Bythopirellula goksoeyrii TaxID=1400387 RepID=A0A5B9QE82_9BACT|nr:hypothetical protein Pr1d_34780 [Bythopirellula goksoeyrii]